MVSLAFIAPSTVITDCHTGGQSHRYSDTYRQAYAHIHCTNPRLFCLCASRAPLKFTSSISELISRTFLQVAVTANSRQIVMSSRFWSTVPAPTEQLSSRTLGLPPHLHSLQAASQDFLLSSLVSGFNYPCGGTTSTSKDIRYIKNV